ncbi:MAG: hypothetical protein RLZZ574_182 [Cyanobacteriota bacterium]
MRGQYWAKFDWRSVLGAIALFTGTVSILGTPAQATPEAAKDSFKLAQVGVTSQINAPIPLNLRPRTHIPLPTNSRSSDYDRYSRYDEYGYGHEHEHHRDRHHSNDRSDTVIIINPANHSNYSSYESYSDQGGYIRIIRQQVVK